MTFIKPMFCVFFSLIIFSLSFIMPSHYYKSIVGESNMAFLNVESLFYYSLCVSFFAFGAKLVSSSFSLKRIKHQDFNFSYKFMVFVLIFCNLLNSLIVYNIFSNNKTLILDTFIFGDSAQNLMGGVDLDGSFSSFTIITSAISLWCYYHNVRAGFYKDLIFKVLVFLSMVLAMAKPFLFMNRVGIMSAISGYAAIFMFKKYQSGYNKSALLYAVLFMFSVVSIFITISFLRASPSNSNDSALLKNLFGYTIVPFSHLGALISGSLKYNDPGIGYYLFSFLRDIPGIGNFIANFMGWQDGHSVWLREFQDTWHAGLNGDLIWLSSFGYVFVSLGWLSPFYFFLYGFFASLAWRSFQRGGDFGIIFYPWLYFCLLFLFGWNVISSKQTLYLLFSLVVVKFFRVFRVTHKDIIIN